MDLTGREFDRWTVQELVPRPPEQRYSAAKWCCRCICGKTKDVWQSALMSRTSKSCGCLRDEVATGRGPEAAKRLIGTKGNFRHGGNRTREYEIWCGMKQRCRTKTCAAYAAYGGRGIEVCKRWGDFANFLADMGPAPSPLHTLDRENNDGHYEPGNCKWSTRKEQARNRRSSARFTHEGKNLTIAEWSEITGVNRRTIAARLLRGLTDPVLVLAPV